MSERPVRKPSQTQVTVLRLLAEHGCDCWGELWTTHWGSDGALAFMNFNRVADALLRRGLVTNADGVLAITDAGRAAASLDHQGGP